MSAGRVSRPGAWGPQQRRAALAITFDNLGEASALERRQWPAQRPLGRHFSVTRALPRVLALLAQRELRATFFVEGVNAQLYPEALREIAAAGHEVAYHGWRHEPWAELDPAREHELLRRGVDALGEIGLEAVGFRPPGGELARSSIQVLAQSGFSYCSPAGDGAGLRGPLAVLPFRWSLIDAFHYLPNFASRRRAALGSGQALAPAALRRAVGEAVARAVRDGALLTVLFHPFLADTDERLDVLRAVLDDIDALVAQGTAWCAPLRDVAAWVRQQPGASGWTLHLDAG